ncbi:acyl-CoA dehydrogenase [Cryobacterium frigoriphilum]|uniref:Acyl-CoA dehydrogenase n=1 Tax=Cryobacterium frigoriphilum TaxID=1259150 RepID=A0A4R9A5U0_9MICO|nr:acyl-CoA dehydrogenase [Cryobacterium frigoriphilum]TFD52737.1 acyl-CoA dehydrogenase [Cryobacterium frigoriphilum]
MSTQTDIRPGSAAARPGPRGPQPVRLPTVTAAVTAAVAAAPPERSSLGAVVTEAAAVRGDPGRALALAAKLGRSVPRIGDGDTATLFETLASLGAIDLTAARVAEAHFDALAILNQATIDPSGLFSMTDSATGVWGVFAAEAGGMRLTAAPWSGAAPEAVGLDAGPRPAARWRLDGTKPWCSLAGSITHALVTAHTSDTERRLFAVDLRQPGVGVRTGGWVALGLPRVPSGPVDFAAVEARPIGADGWYLSRPGFAWGGIGVAACWFGGAVGLARQLYAAEHRPPNHAPDQVALAHLGAIDVLLSACATTLAQAAAAIDSGAATGVDGARLAARVRGLVARTVDEVICRVGHALGPTPLAFDARHAQRVADLQLYVRQHHAERDDAALGRLLLATRGHSAEGDAGTPW